MPLQVATRLRQSFAPGAARVNQFLLLAHLGAGAFGEVLLAEDETEKKLVALKSFSKSRLSKKRDIGPKGRVTTALEKVEAEILAMQRLGAHRNIVQLLAILSQASSDDMYLVLDYADAGELLHYSDETGRFRFTVQPELVASAPASCASCAASLSGAVPRRLAAQLIHDLLAALAFCHAHGTAHRDVKPANCLLTSDGRLLLADFGVCAYFPAADTHASAATSVSGSIATTAPASSASGNGNAERAIGRPVDAATSSAAPVNGVSAGGGPSRPADWVGDTAGTFAFLPPEACCGSGLGYSAFAADAWAAGVVLHALLFACTPVGAALQRKRAAVACSAGPGPGPAGSSEWSIGEGVSVDGAGFDTDGHCTGDVHGSGHGSGHDDGITAEGGYSMAGLSAIALFDIIAGLRVNKADLPFGEAAEAEGKADEELRGDDECIDLLLGLLSHDPGTRLTPAAALKHPFLRRYGFGHVDDHDGTEVLSFGCAGTSGRRGSAAGRDSAATEFTSGSPASAAAAAAPARVRFRPRDIASLAPFSCPEMHLASPASPGRSRSVRSASGEAASDSSALSGGAGEGSVSARGSGSRSGIGAADASGTGTGAHADPGVSLLASAARRYSSGTELGGDSEENEDEGEGGSSEADSRVAAGVLSSSPRDGNDTTAATVSVDVDVGAVGGADHDDAVVEPLILCGWLRKQGRVVPSWRRRFFALRGCTLRYYSSDRGADGGSVASSSSGLGSGGMPRAQLARSALATMALGLGRKSESSSSSRSSNAPRGVIDVSCIRSVEPVAHRPAPTPANALASPAAALVRRFSSFSAGSGGTASASTGRATMSPAAAAAAAARRGSFDLDDLDHDDRSSKNTSALAHTTTAPAGASARASSLSSGTGSGAASTDSVAHGAASGGGRGGSSCRFELVVTERHKGKGEGKGKGSAVAKTKDRRLLLEADTAADAQRWMRVLRTLQAGQFAGGHSSSPDPRPDAAAASCSGGM